MSPSANGVEGGLSHREAEERYRRFGPNDWARPGWKERFGEAGRIFLDPMGLMLLALSGLYWLTGKRSDSWVLLAAYLPITGVNLLFLARTRRALRILRGILQPVARVLREGKVVSLPVARLVPGDRLLIEEGQTFPADGRILEAHGLLVDESPLTGESLPQEKSSESEFFAGTLVLQGRGWGMLENTGRRTRLGSVASLLRETRDQETPLQRLVGRWVKVIFLVALALAAILTALLFWRGASALDAGIGGLTFAMSAVPEEFPMVFALYLSLGAWRLARRHILVRSLPAVEALGRVDVICIDKTGTLTEGKFTLEEVRPVPQSVSSRDPALMARLACDPVATDAMDRAICAHVDPTDSVFSDWVCLQSHPLHAEGKYVSHRWRAASTGSEVLAMKGSLEGVLSCCSISAGDKATFLGEGAELSGQGKRVLGLAVREGPLLGERIPDETGLRFLGFLVFSDPVRRSAASALEKCREAGIEVKILTGDHPHTARAVAEALGLRMQEGQVYTGSALRELSDREKQAAYRSGMIFARVVPEQKHEMVRFLKRAGKVVAMAGDGINDAPALKLADVGISMGPGATDVARSAGDLILLQNDLQGLVDAVFEGRRIFANLRRSFSYLVAFHIPVVLLALVPPALGWGSLLLPVHIVLLELMVHPISAFTFEGETSQGAPKNAGRLDVLPAILAGGLLSLLAVLAFGCSLGEGVAVARSRGLGLVIFGNLFFVWGEHREPNPLRNLRLWITTGLLGVLAATVFLLPSAARFLSVSLQEPPALVGEFLLSSMVLLPLVWMRKEPPKRKKFREPR